MGEIGISVSDFYSKLRWWEVKSIIKGYNRRNRDLWSAHRWSTFNIIASFLGGDKLHEKGIFYPSDILHLPWDKKELTEPLSKSEIDELQSLIDAENSK